MSDAPIEAAVAAGPPVRTAAADVANNLPTYLTSFIGRQSELDELGTLLTTTRLLTLTGSGGCGKTRLAAHLARSELSRFPDGAWWLELAPVSEATLVETVLAGAVGVRPLPGRTPLDAAIAHLASARALLVFDNCEHVLPPCRHLVAALLRACPDLTIVATSREPIGIGGETTWRVPSLSLPSPGSGAVGDGSSAPPSVDSDAVRLFTERARKVRPDFALSPERARVAGRICEALGGIPLAIELAAVRVRVLSLERIDAELADRFHLLTGGERGVLPRLQTLRASVDWSYELLDSNERALLRRCGVFSGGFTLDACEAVCTADDLDGSDVLDLLTSLVDKSLVLVEDRGATRYGMLETIRQYARERLVDAGELDAVLDRHGDAFLSLAESTAPTLGSDIDSNDLLGADAANLYAAIDHTARVAPGLSLRCCIALAYWWLLTGRLVEGPAALTRAIEAAAPVRSPLLGAALFWRGFLAFFAADYERTRSDENEALGLAQEFHDTATEARVLNALGLLESQRDPGTSLTMLDRARELARAAPDAWCLSDATQNLGWALIQMGHYTDARSALDESFAIADANGWRELVSWHWLMVGHVVYPTGDLEMARAFWERGLEGASDVQVGFAMWSLGLVDVDAGATVEALRQLEVGRERMVHTGAGMGVQFVDSGIGLARAALGDLDVASGLLRTAAREHSQAFAWAEAITRIDLARVDGLRGAHAEARTSADRALSIAEHIGHIGLAARARLQLGAAAAAREEWGTAEHLAHRALGDQLESGDRIDVPESLELLAEVAMGRGSLHEAVRVLAAAGRARADLGRARWVPHEARVEHLRLQLHAALGAVELAQVWTEGEAMTVADVTDYVRRARGTRQRPSHGWESLTPTELAIVRHVATGLSNPEIAERMFISRGTVKVHLSHVYAKVGLRNRSEVTAEVIRRDLLDHP